MCLFSRGCAHLRALPHQCLPLQCLYFRSESHEIDQILRKGAGSLLWSRLHQVIWKIARTGQKISFLLLVLVHLFLNPFPLALTFCFFIVLFPDPSNLPIFPDWNPDVFREDLIRLVGLEENALTSINHLELVDSQLTLSNLRKEAESAVETASTQILSHHSILPLLGGASASICVIVILNTFQILSI